MFKKEKIFSIPKNIFILGLVSLLNDASSEMIYPLIPVFLTTVIGANIVTIGIIEGIAESAASFLRAFSGYFSDKIRKRKIFIFSGYLFSMIARPALSLATSSFHVFLVKFFDRIGKGVREAPRDSLISLSVHNGEVGKFFGFHRAMDTTGAIIGPILAFLLLPLLANNLRHLFFLSLFFGILVMVLIIFFVKDKTQESCSQPFNFSLKLFDWRFKLYLLALFILSLATFSPAFLFLKAREAGLSIILIPLIYAAANVVYALFSTPAGILADHIGHRNTLMIGLGIFVLTFIGFGSTNNIKLIWLLFILWGLYSALTDGTIRAITSDLVPEDLRGTAFGLQSMIMGLALLPASVIAGFLWQNFNSSIAFYTSASLAFIAMIVLWWSVHREV
ncbi:MFS transporter [Candidatus Azambacteria bacterium]|nr:MFS transporter [Candidatus Azambacteria bacterium]